METSWASDQFTYPHTTNNYETKFEADRALQQGMISGPVMITPQKGCVKDYYPPKAKRREGFACDAERQLAETVDAVGGWFNLFVLILLVITVVYQYRVIQCVYARLDKLDPPK
jgi:hypothetical protein